MADKSVGELIAAKSVTPTDLFVLEQNGTAKKLTGQILENWLVSLANGHGGIHSIEKVSTSGLVDTYRITLADQTVFDFVVTNGRSVNSITKVSTSGLVDTYQIDYNDGSPSTFTVTNGAKGDKGDNAYMWIKYASQEPTASSHSFGDVPDAWIGVYSGNSSTAPTDWQQYQWYQFKGNTGDTGAPATVTRNVVEYQASDSGTTIPSGSWSTSVPVVSQGRYLWTRTTTTFNSGDPAVSYSVSRMGIDGTGSVVSVAGISPDGNGNVPLTAGDVGALPNTGGDLTGELRMNGQPISGLNAPTANDQAANMGFVNQQMKKAAPWNALDNSNFRYLVAKEGIGGKHGNITYAADRWILDSGTVSYQKGVGLTLNGSITQKLGTTVSGASAFVGVSSGSADITFNASQNTVTITSNGGVLIWAALYEGERTAETRPEYHQNRYGVELAECQRYYRKFSVRTFGVATAVDKIVITYPLSPTMRANPTVSVDSCKYYNTTTWTYDELKGSEESIVAGQDFAFIQFKTSSSIFNKGDIYIIHPLVMTVSADL